MSSTKHQLEKQRQYRELKPIDIIRVNDKEQIGKDLNPVEPDIVGKTVREVTRFRRLVREEATQ